MSPWSPSSTSDIYLRMYPLFNHDITESKCSMKDISQKLPSWEEQCPRPSCIYAEQMFSRCQECFATLHLDTERNKQQLFGLGGTTSPYRRYSPQNQQLYTVHFLVSNHDHRPQPSFFGSMSLSLSLLSLPSLTLKDTGIAQNEGCPKSKRIKRTCKKKQEKMRRNAE